MFMDRSGKQGNCEDTEQLINEKHQEEIYVSMQ